MCLNDITNSWKRHSWLVVKIIKRNHCRRGRSTIHNLCLNEQSQVIGLRLASLASKSIYLPCVSVTGYSCIVFFFTRFLPLRGVDAIRAICSQRKKKPSCCLYFWWRFTAAKFTIRNFYNPSSQNCKPNNFLKSSSILTLMSLNSAFKHVSLLHSDNYKERPNVQNKENFKLLKK